jgi:hypothetical protein
MRIVYALFVLYALLIAGTLVTQDYSTFVFNAFVLAVLFGAYWFAVRKDRYAKVFCAALALFIIPLAATYFGYVLKSSVLGEDKLFHFAGGAVLSWFGVLFFGQYTKNRVALAFAAVCFAAAVGAWWEVYEWVLAVAKNSVVSMTLTDSMLDIVADTLGALAVAVWYKGKK